MKFKDLPYERPDVEKLSAQIDDLITKLESTTSKEEVIKLMHAFDSIQTDFDTMASLSHVRHAIDTRDEFYDQENSYFNENAPLFQTKCIEFNTKLNNSPLKEEVAKEVGSYYFDLLECTLVIDDKAVPFLQKQNELVTKYEKLIASAQIEFDGKTYTLAQMVPLMQDVNRDNRRRAAEANSAWFAEHEAEFDEIYDQLVHTRTDMAHALGFKSFVDLAYKMLSRTCYTSKEVKAYREKLHKTMTPVVSQLYKEQAERIGIKDFKYYDRSVVFEDGTPNPVGGRDEIVDGAQKMYRELSDETGKFFDFMVENELMDLVAKPGKRSGGFCTCFDKFKSPFIFSNFNGTKHDIEVITHEAGHAFQIFSSLNMPFNCYLWPTYEACEIHSMSMEFLTWPWMDLFFKEKTNKFKYAHLLGSLTFLPYGATVDEFQHFVYENPDVSPEERKAKWREIELKYQPELDYDNDFLNKGTFWFRQGHIFASPFYYIDYTLAQVCAFQYLLKSLDDREKTIQEYITLCHAGGSKNFFDLTGVGKIKNPMTTDVLEEITPKLLDLIHSIEI